MLFKGRSSLAVLGEIRVGVDRVGAEELEQTEVLGIAKVQLYVLLNPALPEPACGFRAPLVAHPDEFSPRGLDLLGKISVVAELFDIAPNETISVELQVGLEGAVKGFGADICP